MSKGDNRLKILYVLDELRENSKIKTQDDTDRFMSANCLIKLLENKYSLTADRKSVYNYIKSLVQYGYDIENTRKGYYMRVTEDFELAELKMIVDALSASRFISAKMTKKLIEKLKKLTTEGADSLTKRPVYLEEAVKGDNVSVIYNVDALHKAIITDKKITFHYQKTVVDYSRTEKLVSVNKKEDDGKDKLYKQSPYALIWKNEYYYVICYDSVTEKEKTFRVDRMKDVTCCDNESRDGAEYFRDVHFEKYANTAFSMYGGEDANIVLRVKNSLAGVIADRFGKKINIYHDDDSEYFRCSVLVQKSAQFFSWLSGFNDDIKLVFPKEIRDEYVSYLKNIVSSYEADTVNE